jgi:hypothetical protein
MSRRRTSTEETRVRPATPNEGCAGSESVKPIETVTLFRPTGPKELALVKASGWKSWPPRLPEQPIFYPVLNEEYARKIATDWNATSPDTGYRGYVTRLRVRADFLDDYKIQTVGASWAREYWIPAAELDAFNEALVDSIEVIAAYEGGPETEPVDRGALPPDE